MNTLFALLLIAHGLVHASLNFVPFQPNTPFWPSWWRPEPGRSWLLSRIGLGPTATRLIGGTLWVAAATGFVAAGLGALGLPILHNLWPVLAAVSAVVSLLMFALFWHPWLVVGLMINLLIVIVWVWQQPVVS